MSFRAICVPFDRSWEQFMKPKCQQCSDHATLHITEVDGTDFREVHLCYKCAQNYLQSEEDHVPKEEVTSKEPEDEGPSSKKKCSICGITFQDFRKTGRLGCPADYDVFRDELRPLLENIHHGLKHIGKIPKRLPADTRTNNLILQFRQELQQAVAVEDYEKAAELRDKIDNLEKVR